MAIENTLSSLIPIIRGLIKDLQKTDGRNVFSYIGDPIFTLSEDFVNETSITVFVNNIVLTTSDWSYNADNNQITIDYADSSENLMEDDIITITYHYYKVYSDEQIKSYIESALPYFVQHRYKKSFEINEDEEIVCIDDIDPTINELYFIAIIASILIDPQNINIDTPEFKLSRNRDDSDQKQIEKAFIQFTRFIGEISFEIIDPNSIR